MKFYMGNMNPERPVRKVSSNLIKRSRESWEMVTGVKVVRTGKVLDIF